MSEELLGEVAKKQVVYKDCFKYKGALIFEKEEVVIDAHFMEKYEKGVALVGCSEVIFEESVASDWIAKKLKIKECGVEQCTKAQKNYVSDVAIDTWISAEEDEEEDEKEKKRDDKYRDWKIIDAVKYVF